MKKTIASLMILAMAFCAGAQERTAFIHKGSIEIGAQVAHTSLESDNSDILLLLNPLTIGSKATLIAPFAQIAYRDNKAIGARLSIFDAFLEMDNLTLDLLNDDMQFDLEAVTAAMSTFGGSVFHRSYYGLDSKNRLAAFTEFSLSLTGGQSDFGKNGDFSKSLKAKLSFSPGLIFFVMNNVAASFSLSMANISYNSIRCYSDGAENGKRARFGSKLGPDITGVNFGVSVFFQ
ncbi:MAG: hypothetical protein MJY41_03145 [Bacteroidales bacterium]|nr:hypothetical protein [Bacteroidales bacterium]